MSSRSKPVATHSSVVRCFVFGLSKRRQAYNDIACLNPIIGNDVLPAHAASYSAVHNYGSHQVAHIGCFSTSQHYIDPMVSEHLQHFFSAFDDG